jgi:hypothetical protein
MAGSGFSDLGIQGRAYAIAETAPNSGASAESVIPTISDNRISTEL